MRAVPGIILSLAEGVEDHAPDALQEYPAESVVVQMPRFLSCLAIVLVATVLRLGASSDDGSVAAAMPAASTSSAHMRQQQQEAGNSSSRGVLSSGAWLESLTPLSCNVFDVLGVTKETVLQLAWLIKPTDITRTLSLPTLVSAYKCVLKYQVSRVTST